MAFDYWTTLRSKALVQVFKYSFNFVLFRNTKLNREVTP